MDLITPTDETVARVRALYAEGLTQREIAAEMGLTQKIVWRLMRNNDIEARKAAPRNQNGAANNNWRDETANYKTLHSRVTTARGRPQHCSVCGTTSADALYEWANLTGAYEDVEDYTRMCVPCHRRFDAAVRRTVA